MKRKVVSLILVLTLAIGLLPMSAFADSTVDLSGCELLYDGEGWKVFPIENKDDTLNVDDLKITIIDKEGQKVPKDAYDLVFGRTYWDEEKDEDVFIPASAPFSLTVNEDYMQSGFGGFAAYAVAKDNSGYTGQTEWREFLLWHKYSFNWFGANADFGEEYRGQCTWSWHDYFAIPANEMHAPVIHGIANEDVEPQYYEITYFERGEQPDFDDPTYDSKLYPETDPLDKMPTDPGKYFVRIDGKEPYYGTSYVDFDILKSDAKNDLSNCELLYDGEGWKAFPIDNKDDTLNVDDLNITVVDREGQEVPKDAYDLVFGRTYWDEEKDKDVFIPASAPFSLTVNSDYMQSGFGGFAAYAVAKDNSGYTGQTEWREFLLWHKYSFNWFGANADFGEEYKGQCTWSWHDYFAIPMNEMHAPVIHGIANEDVDPQYYELTYFERGEQPDFDDPTYDSKLYPETDPLDKMPTDSGKYFVRIDGKEPYYGTSYVDFDILPKPESFAMVRGSDRRYYDGDTIYMDKNDDIYVSFEFEPDKGWIPGWRDSELHQFACEYQAPFEGESTSYAHITAPDQAGVSETLYYDWYRVEDIFDEHGGMHWDTAEPVMSCSVILAVMPDEYDYLLGDANGDGKVTINDVTIIQRYFAKLPLSISADTLMWGDVDGDGRLTIADATFIQRHLTNLPVPYDVGKPILLQ
nr:dockerin type I repeat-containing protein [uncultured Ruminococcus sp.]